METFHSGRWADAGRGVRRAPGTCVHPPPRPSVFLRAGESGAVNRVRDAHASATARSLVQAPRGDWGGERGKRRCRGQGQTRSPAWGKPRLQSPSRLSEKPPPRHHLGLRVLITLAMEAPSKEVRVRGWKVLPGWGDRQL